VPELQQAASAIFAINRVKNRRHGSTPSFDDVSDIAAPLFQGCFVANENHFVELENRFGPFSAEPAVAACC
jgi:hypothetical protein